MSASKFAIGRLLRRLRRGLSDERGGALPLVVLGMPMIFGAGAVAFDAAHLYSVRAQLQATADIAARTAVGVLPDEDAARQLALDYASRNMSGEHHGAVVDSNDIAIGSWDSRNGQFSAGFDGGGVPAVRVVARRSAANGNPVALALAPVIGMSSGDVTAESTAALVSTSTACVLSLAENGAGIAINGNVSVAASECGFAANSPAAWAMAVEGAAANIEIASLHLTGGLSDAHGTVNTTEPPQVNTGRTLRDPYAGRDFSDLPTAVSPTADVQSRPNNAVDLEPGVYPDAVDWKGEVNLAPGVYVMQNNLNIGAQARVRGEGVTLVIDDPDVDINGGASVELSAPTSGSTRGIAMLRSGSESGIDMGGGSGMVVNGAIYMPSSSIRFRGTSAAGGCLQIVASRVFLGGTPDFEHDCAGTGVEPIEIKSVELVR